MRNFLENNETVAQISLVIMFFALAVMGVIVR